MPTAKQRAAARRNIKHAAKAARRKRTISKLPKKTRTALAKQATAGLVDHRFGALTTATPYVFAAVAAGAVLVVQSAFQAAPLQASLPVLSVVEPLASVVIGMTVFSESIRTSPPAVVAEVAGMAVLLSAVVSLTRG